MGIHRPSSLILSNTDLLRALDNYLNVDIEVDASPYYYGFEDADGNWYIRKETLSGTAGSLSALFARGTSGYTTAWTNRASQSYNYPSVVF
jgi:hypothetical protein